MKRRALADPTVVEQYIRGGVMPRFMLRLREIDDGLRVHRSRLEFAYSEMRQGDGDDPYAFEERWLSLARAWRFDRVNELIAQHNEYYPIERNLAVNPRTGEYVTVSGRDYRRQPVGEAWILERFPA